MTGISDLFSDVTELRHLAARASTLDERMAGGFVPTATPTQDGRRRLERWSSQISPGGPERFRERLALAGWREAQVARFIGPVELAEDAALPPWAQRLPRLLSSLSAAATVAPVPAEGGPFVDLFLPLGRDLVDDLARRHDFSRWSEAARRDLGWSLLQRLVPLFADSLYEWFRIFRKVQEPAFPGAITDPARLPTTEIYEAYLAWLRSGHLQRLVRKLPVLGRLFVVVSEQWQTFAAELLQRLESDYPLLVNCFFLGRDPGQVVGLVSNIADPHDHGRQVIVIRFASGDQLLYKPRDLAIDGAFGELLGWLREHGSPADLRTPKAWCGSGYGWSEFIPASPCRDRTDVALFYRRAGAMLCLVHALGGSDLHDENVISAGSEPVLVDLETVLGPADAVRPASGQHPALTAAAERISRSALATGYLPRWSQYRGEALGRSGLARSPAPYQTTDTGFQCINTDAMRYGAVSVPIPPAKHLPELAETIEQPEQYSHEIEQGFRAMGRFLAANREALLGGPLQAFCRTTVRTVRRDTHVYALLRQRALQPEKLCDGVDFGLELEFLFRLDEELDRAHFQQVELERHALERLDIPCFRVRADTTVIHEAGGGRFELLEGEELRNPWERLVQRLEHLDQAEIDRQCRLIQLSFNRGSSEGRRSLPWPSAGGVWSAIEAVERAVELGELICRKAIVRGGGAAWLGIVAVGREERLQYDTVGFDLYAGSGGIALFLAALFRATDRVAFRELSRQSLVPLLELVNQHRRASRWARAVGVGGAVGLGSTIYSLVRVAELADFPLARDCARTVAELITHDLIGADTTFDVVGGAAGAILGLLALAAAGEAPALDKAIECGRHLLTVGRADLLQPSRSMPCLGGFAHGASGIAYSLQRLARAAGEGQYERAAAEWIAVERRLFDAEIGNWADLRFPDSGAGRFSCNWCHGAAGVGFARLDGGTVDAAVAHEIDVALRTTLEHPMGICDHLCCGNFGRLDFLLTAGDKLQRPDLVALARKRAATRLDATRGAFAWALGTDADNPGFFQGISGIGYELLRLAQPDELPSVLLWH